MVSFVNMEKIISVPVPRQTDTYTPVPHGLFLNLLRDKLLEAGYNIENTRLRSNFLGTRVVGFYDVTNEKTKYNSEFRMSIGFKNSYDKSMCAALAVGGVIVCCSNGMIAGDLITFKKKHTGDVVEELKRKMDLAISKMDVSYERLIKDASIMSNYNLNFRQKSELLGVMYFEKEIFNPRQLSVVKQEIKDTESNNPHKNSAWGLYNDVTIALRKSHPMRYIEDHIRLHDFMSEVTGLNQQVHSEETVSIMNETLEIPFEDND